MAYIKTQALVFAMVLTNVVTISVSYAAPEEGNRRGGGERERGGDRGGSRGPAAPAPAPAAPRTPPPGERRGEDRRGGDGRNRGPAPVPPAPTPNPNPRGGDRRDDGRNDDGRRNPPAPPRPPIAPRGDDNRRGDDHRDGDNRRDGGGGLGFARRPHENRRRDGREFGNFNGREITFYNRRLDPANGNVVFSRPSGRRFVRGRDGLNSHFDPRGQLVYRQAFQTINGRVVRVQLDGRGQVRYYAHRHQFGPNPYFFFTPRFSTFAIYDYRFPVDWIFWTYAWRFSHPVVYHSMYSPLPRYQTIDQWLTDQVMLSAYDERTERLQESYGDIYNDMNRSLSGGFTMPLDLREELRQTISESAGAQREAIRRGEPLDASLFIRPGHLTVVHEITPAVDLSNDFHCPIDEGDVIRILRVDEDFDTARVQVQFSKPGNCRRGTVADIDLDFVVDSENTTQQIIEDKLHERQTDLSRFSKYR